MRFLRIGKATLFLLASTLLAPCVSGQSSLVLKNSFIEQFKNRVTIDANYIIDHAHKKPNAIGADGKDGDLHFAGRTDDVGLPMVAEIINAAATPQQPALNFVHQQEGSNNAVAVSGAWRVWFEHPPAGGGQQIQGDPVPVPANTNPDHVFEIHPVTKVDDQPVLQSFVPVPNFQAYDAQTAFGAYESLTATIEANDSATQITAPRAGHNYAEFVIQLQSAPQPVDDGFMVLAIVLDTAGNVVVSDPRRMVFASGTAPAAMVQNLNVNDQMHVLGIPRVNLERVSFAMQSNGGAAVTIPLPYEMIIVGVFSGQ